MKTVDDVREISNNVYINLTDEDEKKKIYDLISNKLTDENYITNNVYIVNRILPMEVKYSYEQNLRIIMIPNHKICVINSEDDNESFDELIEDIGKISWMYKFEKIIGRTKIWRDEVIIRFKSFNHFLNTKLSSLQIEDDRQCRLVNILISLVIGSINNYQRIQSLDLIDSIIDKIKRRIVLLDPNQLEFIYNDYSDKKRVVVQGLIGTGKSELLFHKLRRLYLDENNYRIALTCHNKILATELRNKVIDFFNRMEVPKQISDEHLKIFHAQGYKSNYNSGLYSYISYFYNVPSLNGSEYFDFDKICKYTVSYIERIKNQQGSNFKYAFDYILIDESQDFPESFFNLCELVTKEKIYIVGDIYQNIYLDKNNILEPDILLNKCYRTDSKNLMFSHVLSLKLFDIHYPNKLNETELNKLGYKIQRSDSVTKLYRENFKRFQDLKNDIVISDSILVYQNINLFEKTIEILKNLIDEFKIRQDDVAIILLDSSSYIYDLITKFQYAISSEFGWRTNNVIESKVRRDNSVFISNRNNVRGLEFPFIICLTKNYSDDLYYRNAIYSILSRSLIRSYLLVEEELDERILKILEIIKRENYIQVPENLLNF